MLDSEIEEFLLYIIDLITTMVITRHDSIGTFYDFTELSREIFIECSLYVLWPFLYRFSLQYEHRRVHSSNNVCASLPNKIANSSKRAYLIYRSKNFPIFKDAQRTREECEKMVTFGIPFLNNNLPFFVLTTSNFISEYSRAEKWYIYPLKSWRYLHETFYTFIKSVHSLHIFHTAVSRGCTSMNRRNNNNRICTTLNRRNPNGSSPLKCSFHSCLDEKISIEYFVDITTSYYQLLKIY